MFSPHQDNQQSLQRVNKDKDAANGHDDAAFVWHGNRAIPNRPSAICRQEHYDCKDAANTPFNASTRNASGYDSTPTLETILEFRKKLFDLPTASALQNFFSNSANAPSILRCTCPRSFASKKLCSKLARAIRFKSVYVSP